MSQVDVILKYTNRAAAITDLISYVIRDENNQSDLVRDLIIPNLQVWLNSQDVIGIDSNGNPITTHNYLAGFFVLVSLPHVVPALRDNPVVQLVIDRDKANGRQSGAILKSTVGPTILQDIRFSPVFAGSDYPWGNWT